MENDRDKDYLVKFTFYQGSNLKANKYKNIQKAVNLIHSADMKFSSPWNNSNIFICTDQRKTEPCISLWKSLLGFMHCNTIETHSIPASCISYLYCNPIITSYYTFPLSHTLAWLTSAHAECSSERWADFLRLVLLKPAHNLGESVSFRREFFCLEKMPREI